MTTQAEVYMTQTERILTEAGVNASQATSVTFTSVEYVQEQDGNHWQIRTIDNLGKDQDWVLPVTSNAKIFLEAVESLVGKSIDLPATSIIERIASARQTLTACSMLGPNGEFGFPAKLFPYDCLVLLQENHNREIRGNTFARFCQDIFAEDWWITNQGIGFRTNGSTSDGQYRMYSCLTTLTPIWTFLVADLTDRAMSKTDIGNTRSSMSAYMLNHGWNPLWPAPSVTDALLKKVYLFAVNHPSLFDADTIEAMLPVYDKDLQWFKVILDLDRDRLLRRANIQAAFILAHRKNPDVTDLVAREIVRKAGEKSYITNETVTSLAAYLRNVRLGRAGIKKQMRDSDSGHMKSRAALDSSTESIYKVLFCLKSIFAGKGYKPNNIKVPDNTRDLKVYFEEGVGPFVPAEVAMGPIAKKPEAPPPKKSSPRRRSQTEGQ